MIPARLPAKLQPLWCEMEAYYRLLRSQVPAADRPAAIVAAQSGVIESMEAWLAAHPATPAVLIKARLHEEIAERFVPQVFSHTPFVFEMGMRPAENWGTPARAEIMPASWYKIKRRQEDVPSSAQACIKALTNQGWLNPETARQLPFWHGGGFGFDHDHHCFGYTKLLACGIDGLLKAIAARQAAAGLTEDQQVTLAAMARSCRAVLRIADRFRSATVARLAAETNPEVRRYMQLAADAFSHIPAQPPRTFYEGLAMLWFLREVTASLEAIGISVIGHPDRMLGRLYAEDIAAGRLTEEEARDLIARWLLPTDVKTFTRERNWPETSTCVQLGGCDPEGNVVWNEVTRLFLEVHQQSDLINPKLNCRYSSESPQAYLELMAGQLLAGHNRFALLNDDVLIAAQMRHGKSEADARRYVNGGCQETMCEGVEHSAGAYYYLNLPGVLSWLLGSEQRDTDYLPAEAAAALPPRITAAASFAELYQQILHGIRQVMEAGARWRAAEGRTTPEHSPSPWFSTSLEGCIEQATDYTAGGARYNPSGITLVGLGTLVDALEAIRVAVYEEQWLSLDRLLAVVSANWEGEEALRQRILHHPRRYGHGQAATDALASGISAELTAFAHTLPNERGAHFQASYFVYYAFKWQASNTAATPDGRRHGDMFTQGIAPNRIAAPQSLTDVFKTLSSIDWTGAPGNAVLDIQLPVGNALTPQVIAATMRTFARMGGPTLQLNCVSPAVLRDAQARPEQHEDLVVRISGLSACFVQLNRDVQDEIIDRAVMAVG